MVNILSIKIFLKFSYVGLRSITGLDNGKKVDRVNIFTSQVTIFSLPGEYEGYL